ncbi:MAG TPA: hypothetical protein VGD84_22815, partial [Pseudonocardiaceae bacterium]
YTAAAVFDGACGLLTEAADRARQALDILIDTADSDVAEARCRAIAAMIVWLDRLIDGATALSTATRTVARGFEQVVTTIEDTRSGPPPASFRQPDTLLTWVDRPPSEEYETGVRDATAAVRKAMADYQSSTSAALRALPGSHPVPGPNDATADNDGMTDTATLPLCSTPPRLPFFDVDGRTTPLVISE